MFGVWTIPGAVFASGLDTTVSKDTKRMTTRRNATISSTLRMTLLAGGVSSLMLLSACGGESESQAAVKEAGRSFTTIALGDANATPTKSAQLYSEAEKSLSAHAGAEDGFAEAAAVGLAMAKRGQASLAGLDASRAETNALRQARIIRGMINEYLTMSAIAQAAGQFDPSAEITEIESIIVLRRDDIGKYQRQMESINAEIAGHESKIEDLRNKAAEQRNQAGGLELQIPRVSATEGAKIAEQVREFTLRADQYGLEASRLEGIVAQLRPGAKEVSLNVEKARAQIKLLGEAIDELRERAAQSQSDAAEARTNANNALTRINNAVKDYQSLRDDEVDSANANAISLIRAAIRASGDARDAVKTVATINKADALQSLAEMLMRQANGEREEGMIYQSLHEANIPGSWEGAMNDANAKADELLAEAQQSYLDAANAMRSVRATGDAGDKLNATAQRLEMLGGLKPEPEETMPTDEDDWSDEDAESFEEDMSDEMSTDSDELTLEEILENTPEEMRETVRTQLQTFIDTIEATDDVDTLWAMLDQIDAQADAMSEMLPPEMVTDELLEQMNAGFDWVKRQIEIRIEEIENG